MKTQRTNRNRNSFRPRLESLEGRRNIVCKLRRALRAERRRGIAGHWTYDLARHAELVRVYRLELASSGLPRIGRR